MSLEIRQVRSRRDRHRFVDVPFRLHRADPRWVPPLRLADLDRISPKHPAAGHQETALWIARRDGEPVGRISACVDRLFDEFQDLRWAWVGFFAAQDDPELARALFETAWEWSEARGAHEAVGPASFTTNDEVGLLVDGYDEPTMILTTWNPSYYVRLWAEGGWEHATDLWGWRFDRSVSMSDRQRRVLQRLRERSGLRVRDGDIKDFDAEVGRFFEVYRSAWERNWGFAPMTEPEVRHLAKDLKRIIDPRFVLFAEDEATGEVVGGALVLPDANEAMQEHVRSGRLLPMGWRHLLGLAKRTRGIRIVALGVKQVHQARAVGPLLYAEIIERGVGTARLDRCEASWVLADNDRMNKPIEDMGAWHSKTWRMYRRALV